VEGGFLALVMYLLFFWSGFDNLSQLRKMGGQDKETELLIGALHSSLIGFLVGALFSPEAYQFFPYFTVAYTSVLLAIARERVQTSDASPQVPVRSKLVARKFGRADELTGVQRRTS
jgi:hypothetical protein